MANDFITSLMRTHYYGCYYLCSTKLLCIIKALVRVDNVELSFTKKDLTLNAQILKKDNSFVLDICTNQKQPSKVPRSSTLLKRDFITNVFL